MWPCRRETMPRSPRASTSPACGRAQLPAAEPHPTRATCHPTPYRQPPSSGCIALHSDAECRLDLFTRAVGDPVWRSEQSPAQTRRECQSWRECERRNVWSETKDPSDSHKPRCTLTLALRLLGSRVGGFFSGKQLTRPEHIRVLFGAPDILTVWTLDPSTIDHRASATFIDRKGIPTLSTFFNSWHAHTVAPLRGPRWPIHGPAAARYRPETSGPSARLNCGHG